MTTKRVFVYGAGGHGKVVADILMSTGDTELAGFADDREELWGTKILGLPVVGNGEWLRREAASSRVAVALGVGEGSSRQLIMERCSQSGMEILTLVHPAATVARSAQLGPGTVVMAGAIINAEAKIGSWGHRKHRCGGRTRCKCRRLCACGAKCRHGWSFALGRFLSFGPQRGRTPVHTHRFAHDCGCGRGSG